MAYGERGAGSDRGWGESTAAERATESKYEKIYEDELDPFKEFDSSKSNELGWSISERVDQTWSEAVGHNHEALQARISDFSST